MNLPERLERHRVAFEKKVPPEVLTIMHRATEDLRGSGAVDKALNTGDPIPRFALENQAGTAVSIDSVLAKGPLVLGFYRGRW